MACRCGGRCAGCQGLGAYAPVRSFPYVGHRFGGSPEAGRLSGIYRGPAEPPPNPNPGAGLGVVAPISNIRYPVCPAWGCEGGAFGSSVGPVRTWIPFPSYPLQPTATTPQPPPSDYPASAPVVSAPTRCPSPNSYIDAAGNCTNDWHNPYSVTLQSPSPVPANTIPADTSLSSTAAVAPSWFSDPNQEIIKGFPNWGLIAAAAGAFMLMRGRR